MHLSLIHIFEIPIFLGAFYGLRRSEALGLKWDAIDFQNNTITIRHTVTSVSYTHLDVYKRQVETYGTVELTDTEENKAQSSTEDLGLSEIVAGIPLEGCQVIEGRRFF